MKARGFRTRRPTSPGTPSPCTASCRPTRALGAGRRGSARRGCRLCRPLRVLARRLVERIHRVEFRGLEHLREPLCRRERRADHAEPLHVFRPLSPLRCGRPRRDRSLFHDGLAGVRPVVLAQAVRAAKAWGLHGRSRRGGPSGVPHGRRDPASRPEPLVVFPEGEMYHLGDQITPFHEGAAAMAIAAARKTDRHDRLPPVRAEVPSSRRSDAAVGRPDGSARNGAALAAAPTCRSSTASIGSPRALA